MSFEYVLSWQTCLYSGGDLPQWKYAPQDEPPSNLAPEHSKPGFETLLPNGNPVPADSTQVKPEPMDTEVKSAQFATEEVCDETLTTTAKNALMMTRLQCPAWESSSFWPWQ